MTPPTAAAAKAPDLPARLRAILGPKGLVTDPDAIAPLLVDLRGLYQGAAIAVARPASTDEVAAVMALCAETGTAVVPQGGNTGLCGGAIPFDAGNALVLSLARMNRVRGLDRLNHTVTVEAGCILAEVQAAAAEAGLLFPLSLGAEGSCRIGGNIATNAGGVAVLRYGNTRDLVLGLEVVLPDGRVWDGLRALRKDNTGYDLKQLFIGSEGTLGVVTAAVLKLFPRPVDVGTALVALRDIEAAVELLDRLRAATGDALSGFEVMPKILMELAARHVPDSADPLSVDYDFCALVEAGSANPGAGMRGAVEAALAAAYEDGLVTDAAIAASEGQARALWRLREAIVEAQKIEGGGIKHDVSVPVSRVPEFVREASRRCEAALPGIRIFAFGHLGDGNMHYNLCWPAADTADPARRRAFLARWEEFNRIVHDLVHEMAGSISAEHGIGVLKREELPRYKSALELDLMRRVKAAIDPQGIMNPGKVV